MSAKAIVREPAGFTVMGKKETYKTAIYTSAILWGEDVTETPAQILSRQSGGCRAFMKEHPELKKIDTYTDRNTVREADREWNRFLDDVEVRKVDALVVNSFHNISTSYSLAGYFFGCFLYPAGVRIIVVEDGFDSCRDDIKEYLEAQRTKQYSYVQMQTKHHRKKENKVCKISVPYGYRFVPEQEPQIAVDEETRPFVRMIFERFIAGERIVDIANMLNEMGAPTPTERRRQLYGTRSDKGSFWKNTHIKKILLNPNYTGDYVTGRYKDYILNGKHIYGTKNPEEWIVVKDYHQPLVTKEEYALAGQRLDAQRFENTHDGESAHRPFRNVFFCADCGTSMRAQYTGRENGLPYMRLICDSGRYKKEGSCKRHGFHFETIVENITPAMEMEIVRARQFAKALPKVCQSEWYKKEWNRLEAAYEKAEAMARSFCGTDDACRADTCIQSLKEAQKARDDFLRLFSRNNPWFMLLSGITPEDLSSYTKESVRRLFSKIYVKKDGTLEIHTAEDACFQMLKKYHRELWEKEGFGLWEEETGK